MLKINRFIKNDLNSEMWGGGIFSDNVEKALSLNLSTSQFNNQKLKNKISKDIIWSYITFGATPEEYFAFGFINKSNKDRAQYLTNKKKDIVLMNKIDQSKISRLKNKYALYKLLPEMFKRDICIISEDKDRTAYNIFVSKHNSYIIKPLRGQCGKGVSILHGDKFDELITAGSWIIEEIVQQVPELGSFNESSVNTVRLPSFYKNGKVIHIAPFFRTGRKGSIVDNGGAGGIFAGIDVKTGVIITDGWNENNRTFNVHPDSGMRYRGFKIPHWDLLLKVSEEAHRRLSDQRYIAWDFALTSKGWVLIEANGMGQFLFQYATKKGIKDKFLELMSD